MFTEPEKRAICNTRSKLKVLKNRKTKLPRVSSVAVIVSPRCDGHAQRRDDPVRIDSFRSTETNPAGDHHAENASVRHDPVPGRFGHGFRPGCREGCQARDALRVQHPQPGPPGRRHHPGRRRYRSALQRRRHHHWFHGRLR